MRPDSRDSGTRAIVSDFGDARILTLKFLMRIFRFSAADIARRTNTAKSYISSTLNNPKFKPSERWWAKLNQAMPDLIAPAVHHAFPLSGNSISHEEMLVMEERMSEVA